MGRELVLVVLVLKPRDGPERAVVHDDPDDRDLVHRAGREGRYVRAHAAVADWLRAHGAAEQRPFTRMARGVTPPGHEAACIAVAGPEFGPVPNAGPAR